MDDGLDDILTPEQWTEVELAMEEDDVASEEEVGAFFARIGIQVGHS